MYNDGEALPFSANWMHLQLSVHLTSIPHSGAFLIACANLLAQC